MAYELVGMISEDDLMESLVEIGIEQKHAEIALTIAEELVKRLRSFALN
jgi:hypothetical protein